MNFLFILTDQQRYDTLGCNGNPIARTPVLDNLAARGACFDNHIVANPVCSPSRASIWTGLYPSGHGLWSNGAALDPAVPTLPGLLSQQGYQTAHMGKMHLVPILNRVEPHPPYGFETCEVAEGDQQYPPHDAYFNWLRAHEPMHFAELLEELYTKGQAKGYPSRLPRPLHQSEWTVDRCTQWLREERDPDRPFFLSAGFFDPHHAFNPLKEYWDLFEQVDFPAPVHDAAGDAARPDVYTKRRHGLATFFADPDNLHSTIRAYHAMVAHVDQCIGRLLQALEESGEAERTCIIFSSDHGELLGDHGMLWKGPFMLDALMRVPLVIAGPGIAPGQRVSAPTSSVDFLSSITTLAGCQAPPNEGQPWFDQGGRLRELDANRATYAEWDAPGDSASSCLRMLRTDRKKIILNPNRVEKEEGGEFYDLETDPHECHNLWDPAEPCQKALRDELMKHWQRPRQQTSCINGW